MADVELVIKISEKAYNALTHTEFDANLVTDEMRKSIANGAALPKGHGRIVDIDKVLEEMMTTRTYDIPFALERVKPIIEADAESEKE